VGVSGNGNNDEPIAQAGADALEGGGATAPSKIKETRSRKKRG
jgi:hypothetical protein